MHKAVGKLKQAVAALRQLFCQEILLSKSNVTLVVTLITFATNIPVYASADNMPLIRSPWDVSIQGKWVVITDCKERGSENVYIYNEYGDLYRKISLAGKGGVGAYATVDRAGNVLIQRTEERYNTFVIYFSHLGEELWRYEFSSFGGNLNLSPDGKYCLNTMNTIGSFELFPVDQPGKKIEIPLNEFDPNETYYADFTNDGSVIMSPFSSSMMLKIDPEKGTIEKRMAVATSEGLMLRTEGNEWVNSWFSNKDKTIFALRMYLPEARYPNRVNWLLVFDENLNIKIFEKDENIISDIKVFDSNIVMSKGNTGQGCKKVVRQFEEKKERVIDNLAENYMGLAVQTDSSFYFYLSPKNGVRAYNKKEHKVTENLPDLPLFKPKKGKSAIRARVAKEQ